MMQDPISSRPRVVPKSLETGFYRHFKGNYYEVLGTCVHSETLETMVLYRPVGSEVLWVRPYSMFTELIPVPTMCGGFTKPVPRFEYIGKTLPAI
jgi:hypothetical protein